MATSSHLKSWDEFRGPGIISRVRAIIPGSRPRPRASDAFVRHLSHNNTIRSVDLVCSNSDAGRASILATLGGGSKESEGQRRPGEEENNTSVSSSTYLPSRRPEMLALVFEELYPTEQDRCRERGSHPGGLGIATEAGKPVTTWTDVTLVSTSAINNRIRRVS